MSLVWKKISLAIAALTDEDAKQKEEAELLAAVDFSSDADAGLLQMAETRSSLGRAEAAAQSSKPSPASSSDSVLRDILDRLTGHVTGPLPSGTVPPARHQATVKLPTPRIPTFSYRKVYALERTPHWRSPFVAVRRTADEQQLPRGVGLTQGAVWGCTNHSGRTLRGAD